MFLPMLGGLIAGDPTRAYQQTRDVETTREGEQAWGRTLQMLSQAPPGAVQMPQAFAPSQGGPQGGPFQSGGGQPPSMGAPQAAGAGPPGGAPVPFAQPTGMRPPMPQQGMPPQGMPPGGGMGMGGGMDPSGIMQLIARANPGVRDPAVLAKAAQAAMPYMTAMQNAQHRQFMEQIAMGRLGQGEDRLAQGAGRLEANQLKTAIDAYRRKADAGTLTPEEQQIYESLLVQYARSGGGGAPSMPATAPPPPPGGVYAPQDVERAQPGYRPPPAAAAPPPAQPPGQVKPQGNVGALTPEQLLQTQTARQPPPDFKGRFAAIGDPTSPPAQTQSPPTPPTAQPQQTAQAGQVPLINRAPRDENETVAKGIMAGREPPDLTGFTRGGRVGKIKAIFEREGFNYADAQREWKTAQKQMAVENTPQIHNFLALSTQTDKTITEALAIAQEMKQGNMQFLNKAALEYEAKWRSNTPKGRLAARYLAATTELQSELASLNRGAYAPTQEAFKLAAKQVNENYGFQAFNDALLETKKIINYRAQALGRGASGFGPTAPNRYAPKQPTDQTPTGGSGQLPTIRSKPEYDALPSGTEFIGEDGKPYRKP